MTLWEAIHGMQERRPDPKERFRQNLAAQGIIIGSDLGATVAGKGIAGRLMSAGAHIPMVDKSVFDMRQLARHAGMLVDLDQQHGLMSNAYYRPPIISRILGQAHAPHGTVGVISNYPHYIPIDVGAHELGHAQSWTGRSGRLAQLIAKARLPGQWGAGGAGLVGLLKGTTGNKSLAEREKWLNATSIAAGAGMTPVLIDEALASRNALRLLRSLPASVVNKEVVNQAVRRLARAWGSYGAAAAGLVLGPQLAKKYYQSRNE